MTKTAAGSPPGTEVPPGQIDDGTKPPVDDITWRDELAKYAMHAILWKYPEGTDVAAKAYEVADQMMQARLIYSPT